MAEKAIAATSPGSRSVRYTTRLQLYAAHVPTRYRMHGCRSIQPCTIYIIYIPRKSPVRASQYSTYELAGVTCVSFLSMRSTSRGRHLSSTSRAPAAAPTTTPNPLACAKCGRVTGNAGALARHVEHCGKPGPTRAEKRAQANKERRAKKRAAAGDAAVEPDAPQDE